MLRSWGRVGRQGLVLTDPQEEGGVGGGGKGVKSNNGENAYRIGTLEVPPEHPLVCRVHTQLLI